MYYVLLLVFFSGLSVASEQSNHRSPFRAALSRLVKKKSAVVNVSDQVGQAAHIVSQLDAVFPPAITDLIVATAYEHKVLDIVKTWNKYVADNKVVLEPPVAALGVFQVAASDRAGHVHLHACFKDARKAEIRTFVFHDICADEAACRVYGYGETKRAFHRGETLLHTVTDFKQAFPKKYKPFTVPGSSMPETRISAPSDPMIITPLDYVPGYGATKFKITTDLALQSIVESDPARFMRDTIK